MKIAIFDAHSFERKSFADANELFRHDLFFSTQNSPLQQQNLPMTVPVCVALSMIA